MSAICSEPTRSATPLRALCTGLLLALFLSACDSSPDFLEPPAMHQVEAPSALEGVWAREGGSERLRAQRQPDGSLSVTLLSAASPSHPPGNTQRPVTVRVLRFDEADWLSLEVDRAETSPDQTVSYKLVQFAIEDEERICGIAPSAAVFAEGIRSGALQGTVKTYAGPLMAVAVSSPGAIWAAWWSGLPKAKKLFAQPVYCLRRVRDSA